MDFTVKKQIFFGDCVHAYDLGHGFKKMVLARPEKRNAFDAKMISEMTECLEGLAQKIEDMRLLILEGEGSVFCAGADLSYMQAQGTKSEEEDKQEGGRLAHLFFTLASFPTPILCAVRGAAIAGGFGLVVCSDFVIAEEDSLFATSEVLLGIVPGVISPYIVRKLGVAHAAQFMLLGKRFRAQQCLSFGLVQEVVTKDNFTQSITNFLQEYLKVAPRAVRRTKQLLLAASPLPTQEQRNFVIEELVLARRSAEGQQGLQAFLEKKAPYWIKEKP